jgi:maltose alpha-D-glucosyltransferase/alpha-amylase
MRDPLWYRDAVFYQLRIPSFYDSNADGIGDLRGLVGKLDYLQDLGVTALWLLPFYPSPLRDDGYDIADYTSVHPDYGTLADFRAFLREAHRRELRVVTELVLNHTSDAHPWFQRARRAAPGSRQRDYYVWSDTPKRYADARIIFKDFESSNWSWDPLAEAYYWHRFYSHQPDLNFDHPQVCRALFGVLDFWLELGVDGLRLDAVPYLFEREGTSCENLPETHALLRELRRRIDDRFRDRMLLAEANQWPEDAVHYFGKGDECHMAFHFPIMPRLFMGIHMENRFPILDILEQTPAIPEGCQWALFLRNHDELTLEMVTDEERDYMWRVYASDPRARINLGIRRRLSPLLGGNRRKIELMNALLLSLPGTPVIYYGDEIGMGDNIYLGDRNSVRTPMQWSSDRNAGFSRANPQRLFLPVITDPEYHYEAVNVEIQQENASSLLWWTKRILGVRKQFRAFGRGSFEPLAPANRRVLAFLRRHERECILVVANLSRFSQYVELDLSEFEGCAPLELFGHVEFPRIGELPYLLTLGPHAFYWFAIEAPRAVLESRGRAREAPLLEVADSWLRLLEGRERQDLERVLPDFLREQPWFRGGERGVRAARVLDAVDPGGAAGDLRLLLIGVDYAEGDPESYVLPVGFTTPMPPQARAIARVRTAGGAEAPVGALVDASGDPRLPGVLWQTLAGRRRLRGRSAEVRGVPARGFRRLRDELEGRSLAARPLGARRGHTSWAYADAAVGKLLRRIEPGASPGLEIARFLGEKTAFPRFPALIGHLELWPAGGPPSTLALFQRFVANEGDAWSFTLDEIESLFEGVLAEERSGGEPPAPAVGPLLLRAEREPPDSIQRVFGRSLGSARLLGQRTGELHAALASHAEHPDFAPEPFTPFSRRSFYQSLRNLAVRTLDLLGSQLASLPAAARAEAQALLERRDRLLERMRSVSERPLAGRRKRSPLADVAGMLLSFHYAVEAVLASGPGGGSSLRPEDAAALEPWGRLWLAWVGSEFLKSYLDAVAPADLLPRDREELGLLLEIHRLEKALNQVGFDLRDRPDRVSVPLRSALEILAPEATRT